MKLSLRHAIAVAVAFGFAYPAAAQPYPSKPIRLIVPFTAGGGTDISARVVGQKLSERLGTSVVIDNRTGAGGMVGTEIVARAAPDGYTLVLVSSSHAINPSLHRRLPYDSIRDFAPVTLVVLSPGVLVVHPAVPARTVKEFVDWVRSKPGQLTYGSAGNGTPVHLSMELLKSIEKIDIVHAPYKGAAAAIPDLLGGQIVAMIPSTASVLPLVKAGKLRALAVTSRTRTAAAPEVPTMIESGVPGYEASSWYGLLAPAGDAARDHRPPQCGDGAGAAHGRRARTPDRASPGSGRQYAAAVRSHDQRGDRQVAPRGDGFRGGNRLKR
jgi:tripartite-type tricarboxylate transporter receptor subunit TctC